MIGRSFDVERDIERARVDRQKREALGMEQTPEQMRLQGGVPLTDRAAVLLDHLIHSHIQAAVTPGLRESEALACARRAVEYVGALEHAVLTPLSVETWDDPRTVLGLSAASLEALADQYGGMPDERLRVGAQEFRTLAARLRVIEARIGNIPGQTASEVQLPVIETPPGEPT